MLRRLLQGNNIINPTRMTGSLFRSAPHTGIFAVFVFQSRNRKRASFNSAFFFRSRSRRLAAAFFLKGTAKAFGMA